MRFAMFDMVLGAGRIGICPMPGRGGDFAGDLAALLGWAPELVLTMTTADELVAMGAGGLPDALAAAGVGWRHLPVADFNVPGGEVGALWPAVAAEVRAVLAGGGRVLVHCMGGCGRSGMAVLRLAVEVGEAPDLALARLRAVRPCAVETEAQMVWALRGPGYAAS